MRPAVVENIGVNIAHEDEASSIKVWQPRFRHQFANDAVLATAWTSPPRPPRDVARQSL